uniref:Uncharacterized protein n=1 Tax=uncultured bacterium A1Q1_fos_1053 TaxID=1256539 RepID=L7VRH2_9BACT|nr:hypothetical protein [uncultured bacterium A1Q1_fos_1053]
MRSLRITYESTKFPFRVFYSCQNAAVILIALAHTARTPGYWKDRLGES